MVEPLSAQAIRPRRPGVITEIGVVYVVLGLALAAAAVSGAQIGDFRLEVWDAIAPVLLTLAGAGAILRKRWGRWSCYFFSVLLLPGVPIGTLIGGMMLYHLTIYRDQFTPEGATDCAS